MPASLSADEFVRKLKARCSPAELEKIQRYFKPGVEDEFIGVRMVGKPEKKNRKRLLSFLDEHAATLPRTFLRYAVEHLSQKERARYLSLVKS